MLCQIFLNPIAPMRSRTIPNQNERGAQMTPKMLQAIKDFLGIDRASKVLFENFAAHGQAGHCRKFTPIFADAFETRCLSARGPSATDRFPEGHTKFVFKNDFCAEPPRFFLSGPNLGSTKRESVFHPAQGRGSLAFAHSSPSHVTGG